MMGEVGDESRRTVWCGNLSDKVTEELLYELFLQAGPLEKVKLVTGKTFAFITFRHEVSVRYTIELLNGTELFKRRLNLQFRNKPDASPGTPHAGQGIMDNAAFQRSYSTPEIRRGEQQREGSIFDQPTHHLQGAPFIATQASGRSSDRRGPQRRNRFEDSSYNSPTPRHNESDMRGGYHRSTSGHHPQSQVQEAQLQQQINQQLAAIREMNDQARNQHGYRGQPMMQWPQHGRRW